MARMRADGAAPWWAEDYQRTIGRFEGQVRTMVQAEIRSKLERARRGRLSYGSGSDHDVEQMGCAPTVLELRLSAQYGDNPAARLHTRIYFNEPAQVDRALRLLSMQCKHDGDPGLAEQTVHATDAAGRLRDCDFVRLG